MQIQPIEIDRDKARELYQSYKKHLHYSTPLDDEIRRAYGLLAKGRLVIKAVQSIVDAGVNELGLPKLALCRAHSTVCRFARRYDGSATMTHLERFRPDNRHDVIRFPEGSFPARPAKEKWGAYETRLPLIPVHVRPNRGLESYHVLWEAEWEPVPPRDPYLLRRIGKGDMWLVVAMWDLTEVERTALAARLTPQ